MLQWFNRMNLLSPKYIKELLGKHGTFPLKRLGQNFLVNKGVAEKVIKAADLKPDDVVLEIGPGIGNLTQELAQRAGKVIAVEKDPKMVEILKETLKDSKNVEIIQKDILSYKLHATSYKIVANLPYYITSPVIRMFLEAENPPETMVLIVQKEKAQRICASPPDMNLLAISVQFYVHPPQVLPSAKFGRAGPKIISYISKKSFWPPPKVDGAILKISAFIQRKDPAFNQRFFRIVKAGFSHPRKQLVNNLLALTLPNGVKLKKGQIKNWLLKNKIKSNQRAETLSIEDWINLTKTY